jgi:TRAP-type mannitol/chloroaromatic compound transport system permease small subunit
MPSLNFVLPHWLYWGGLLVFPLVAMYLVRHQRAHGVAREPTIFTAYLFWLCAGFLGLHRMYLRSWWGLAFLPFFIAILYCNSQARDVRDDVSRTFAALEQAQTAVRVAQPRQGVEPSEEDRATLAKAQADLRSREPEYEQAKAVFDGWHDWARRFAIALAVLLVIDAALIPGVVRRQRAAGTAPAGEVADAVVAPEVHEQGTGEDPTLRIHTRFTDVIDAVNGKIGEFVAYWGVIAVFVYYYEVVGRYVFNSPTNWVHESMVLMFGMQFMLSGAYAYREDQHVRVDVLYVKLSARGKAIADIISSVFFFIFTLTLVYTGGRFALDAINNSETSFTEWGIQYWPVKLAIPIGAALIVMQGVAKLVKDIVLVTRREA